MAVLTLISGGEEVLLDVGGQDATEAFEDVGHSDEAREILQGLLVGNLKRAVCLHTNFYLLLKPIYSHAVSDILVIAWRPSAKGYNNYYHQASCHESVYGHGSRPLRYHSPRNSSGFRCL
jgi:hypothetical protein